MVNLLLVEDDDTIADPLVSGLIREGFAVERAETGEQALHTRNVADLILLDLGLPDLDGREVCRQLSDRRSTPIIVVTARSDEVDRVLLLELGADDYVVKPFGFRELVARIRAVLRRSQDMRPRIEDRQRVGALEIDRRAHTVHLDGRPIELTPKEFDLLAYLAADAGAALSRTQILRDVWDTTWYGPTKTLDVHVASLRRKLGDPAWIQTVRGVGFRFETQE